VQRIIAANLGRGAAVANTASKPPVAGVPPAGARSHVNPI
jgi:hypothetical protein